MSAADLLDRTAREIVAECRALADLLVARHARAPVEGRGDDGGEKMAAIALDLEVFAG